MVFVYVQFVDDGVRKIVSPSDIKRFSENSFDSTKTYKVLYEEEHYRAYILSVGATEEEALNKANQKRFRMPARRLMDDNNEESTEDELSVVENEVVITKNKTKKNDFAAENFNNILKINAGKETFLKPKADLSQLTEKNKYLEENNRLLEAEVKQLRTINRDLQLEVINKIKDMTLNVHTEENIQKIGSKKNGMIHLGNDVWLPIQIYSSAANKPTRKDYSMFIKELAVAVFGQDILGRSSVTGISSNRTKGVAKPPLDPTKLKAIHDIVLFRMREKGEPEERIRSVCGNINNKISEKIHDIVRPPRSKNSKASNADDQTENSFDQIKDMDEVEMKENTT